MTAVDNAFNAFDASLNLSISERVKAQTRHNEIRGELVKAGLLKGSFLQGSFARKTMLRPLKDVDIVCLFSEAHRPALAAPGGPALAMAMMQAVVAKRWPSATFDEGDEPAAKALRVGFPDFAFTFDLVPALDTDSKPVKIGDREKDVWIDSRTRWLNELISERNVEIDGLFVHQVRMGKTIKHDHAELRFLDGLLIESLFYDSVYYRLAHPIALVAFLEHAAIAVTGAVYDPTREGDLTAKWSSAERVQAVQKFGELAKYAREAVNLAKDDEQAALENWHAVFPNGITAPEPRTPTDVMKSWMAGSITSTARPTLSTAGAVAVNPGRSHGAS